MHDTIILGGRVVDGSGEPAYSADIAIDDGVITEIGKVTQSARRVIDADGCLVTPGFVDPHTHYDGQVTWDDVLGPSVWHGVTTVVMGNCGVGFAPVRPGGQDELIAIMEGVEDIPGTALSEGIDWRWESFPEYLDALDKLSWTMDVGTQVPYAAVRTYVMGDRATSGVASAEEIAQMRQIVSDGVRAGALGVSVSRILAHTTSTGTAVPGTFADEPELTAMGQALVDAGSGVYEIVPRGMDGDTSEEAHAEIDLLARIARLTGRPVTFAMVQTHTETDRWRELLEHSARLRDDNVLLYPQVTNRFTGILFGLQSVNHAFSTRPSYREIEHLPLLERVEAMRDPERRRRIMSEPNSWDHPLSAFVYETYANQWPMGFPVNPEPLPQNSLAAIAAAQGRAPEDVCYDVLLEHDGRSFIIFPFTNYFGGSLDDVHSMLTHSSTVWGLSDGGAHCGLACDASSPTIMLSHWTRDRDRGPRVSVEQAVRWMTHDTASLYGLNDRGLLKTGKRADVNVIDYANLAVELPEMIFDLPAGGRRLMQRAKGYRYTLVHGEVTIEHDKATDARPGRLIRGAR